MASTEVAASRSLRPLVVGDGRRMLQQGVPARVAMQILGHSQISLTLGTYSHVVPELAQEGAERIDRVLWAP